MPGMRGSDPASLDAWVHQRLAAAQAAVDRVTAVKGAHTVENTLRPFDDAQNELAIAGNESYLMFAVGDSAEPAKQRAGDDGCDLFRCNGPEPEPECLSCAERRAASRE